MSTLGDMKTRIAQELMAGGRSDLAAQVESAIHTAIRHYRGKPFGFNQGLATSSTVAGQATQTPPANILSVDFIRIDHGSGFNDLDRKDFKYLQRMRNGSASNGKPWCWAEQGGAYWFWQTPDAIYSLEWYGVLELDALAADADTNAWMVEGEELIRQRARAIVQVDVLKDSDARTEMVQVASMGGPGRNCLSLLERAALRALRGEFRKQHATGVVKPG